MTTTSRNTPIFLASLGDQVHITIPRDTEDRMPALCGDTPPVEEIDMSEVTVGNTLCAECVAEYLALRHDQQDKAVIALILVHQMIRDYLNGTSDMMKTLSAIPETMELLKIFEGVARSAAEYMLSTGYDRPDTTSMINHMITRNLPDEQELRQYLAQREARKALKELLATLDDEDDEDDEQENQPTSSTSSDPSTWTVPWSATIAPLDTASENGKIIRSDCKLEVCEDATLSDETGETYGTVALLASAEGYVHASGMCSPDVSLDGPPIFECVDMDGSYKDGVFSFSRITLRRVMVGGRVRVPAWPDSKLTFSRS